MLSLTFYTEKFLGTYVGRSFGPIIVIKPSYKTDIGLQNHEEHHAVQWWFFMCLGGILSAFVYSAPELSAYSRLWFVPLIVGASLHGLLYYFVWQYRLWAEVSAYRVQAKYYEDDRRPKFSRFVHTKYSLSEYISEAEIHKKMTS